MSTPVELAFPTAGVQRVPELRNITQIAGTTPNSLQAMATDRLNPPYTVMVTVAGVKQLWTAKTGLDATDVPNGICQAGDFPKTGIVWYQSTV